MFIWWLVFNPGFYSGDSFAIIEMVKSAHLSSEWTAIWAIFVKVLTLSGSHPEFATLFFSQLLAFSVSIFALTLFKGKTAMWSSVILSATPLVGAMGITLWHDIPMTSGFLLAVAGVQRLREKQSHAKVLLLFGIIFSSFRYNGLPTLILATLVLILFVPGKKRIALILVAIILAGVISSVLDSKFSPPVSTHSDGLINWMRYDLSCYAASSTDQEFFQKEFQGKATLQDWSSQSSCTWFNDSKVFYQRSDFIDQKIPSAWMALAKSDPVFVLSTHLRRNAYLNPIPLFGLPSMPFIHTTIEIPDKGIAFWNPSLSESLRIYPRSWNYLNYIFGYSGFWLLLIFLFAWWKKNSLYLAIGILGLILNSSVFVFAIISDGRFSLFVLVAGQLILIAEIVDRVRVAIGARKGSSSLSTRFQE